MKINKMTKNNDTEIKRKDKRVTVSVDSFLLRTCIEGDVVVRPFQPHLLVDREIGRHENHRPLVERLQSDRGAI